VGQNVVSIDRYPYKEELLSREFSSSLVPKKLFPLKGSSGKAQAVHKSYENTNAVDLSR
jgi:hypothetical protein